MASPDNYVSTDVWASINLDSGAYSGWDQAQPFTTGRFFGYWSFAGTPTSSGTLYLYECALGLAYAVVHGSTNVRFGCLGKFLHVGSDSSVDSEADGNVYGVHTTGAGVTMSNITIQYDPHNLNSCGPFFNNNTAFRSHTGIFSPGLNIIKRCFVSSLMPNYANFPTHRTMPSGKFVVIDRYMPLVKMNAPHHALGVLDGFMMFEGTQHGRVLADTVNNKDIGYTIGEQTTIADSAWLLLRNDDS